MNLASDFYNSTLSKILDKMIPFKTFRVRERPFYPWFECRASKCLKRSLKRIHMRTKSENDFAAWLGRKKLYKSCVDTSVEVTGIINSMIRKTKRLTCGAILIVSGRRKKSSLDGIQPVEILFFLLKKVE